MKLNTGSSFLLSVFTLMSLPTLSFAQSNHEEIVEQFLKVQSRRPHSEPTFTNHYKIPKLDHVIPRYMQLRLRNRNARRESFFDAYERSRDFRHRDTPIISQIGSRCSAYGLVASLENLLGAPKVAKLSESHLWSSYRRYSSISAVDAAKRMLITESQVWPHDTNTPHTGWEEKAHTRLNYITFIEDDVGKAVKALSEGRPIYIGFSVTRSLAACEAVLDPRSSETGGGHAVSISGYGLDERIPGGGYFILKNSWGSDCGENGYSYMPFNYCTRGGSSYCIMWDVQGVSTKFPGVPGVEPELPKFDMSEMDVRLSSYRPWYRRSRTVTVDIEGNSLHARQIKEVSYSLDGGSFSRPVKNNIDSIGLSFVAKKSAYDIMLRIILNNGEIVQSGHRWRL